jgi:hypothetical protein
MGRIRKVRPQVANIAPPVVAVAAPRLGIFRNAITERDNVSINVGYLSLFWIMVVVLTVIPFMVVGACFEAYYADKHVFPYAELGKGVGFVTGAFGVALAALGAFIWGDTNKDKAAVTTVTATTITPPPVPSQP